MRVGTAGDGASLADLATCSCGPGYLLLGRDDHVDYLVFFGGTSLCLKASFPVVGRPYYSMHDT
jgi:hypothetical protein